MSQGTSDHIVEIPTPPLKKEAAVELAKALINTPFIISRKTRQIAAIIEAIALQPKVFICALKVLDDDLSENFNDDKYIADHFIEVDFSAIFDVH